MQKYNKKEHSARLLTEKLQNIDLLAVLEDLLHYSIIINDNQKTFNEDGIFLSRAFLPFLLERNTAKAETVIQDVSINEMRTSLLVIIKDNINANNGIELIKGLRTIYDFTAIIDDINQEIELEAICQKDIIN
jgi:hypothetical protein